MYRIEIKSQPLGMHFNDGAQVSRPPANGEREIPQFVNLQVHQVSASLFLPQPCPPLFRQTPGSRPGIFIAKQIATSKVKGRKISIRICVKRKQAPRRKFNEAHLFRSFHFLFSLDTSSFRLVDAALMERAAMSWRKWKFLGNGEKGLSALRPTLSTSIGCVCFRELKMFTQFDFTLHFVQKTKNAEIFPSGSSLLCPSHCEWREREGERGGGRRALMNRSSRERASRGRSCRS